MTTPFGQGQQTWPSDPTMPSAAPAGYMTPTLPDPSRVEPAINSTEAEARRNQFYDLLFQKFLVQVTGFFVPGVSTFDQLQTWAESVGLGDLLEILTGVPDADNNDLGSWVNSLLYWARPVPQIQAASVVDTNPNLLIAPDFSAAGTVVSDQGWVWDNSAGHDSIGSASIVAIGIVSELVSNQVAAVAGQKIDLSVWVRWDSVSYTGTNPIAIGVTRYMGGAEVGSTDLAFIATPAGTSGWTRLAYDAYEVPAGCDEIRMRFKIGANLTGGTLYWDDASVTKTQPGSGYIGSFLDQVVNGLENVNAPGWDLTDVLISMLNQFRTTADHAARITYLESLQSTGNKINDEFLRVGTTLGGNWNQTYGAGAGTWETDGDYAFFRDSGISAREVRCRYIGSPSTTLTDTQKIVCVLGSKGEDYFIPFILQVRSYIFLYGRMDTGETNWVRVGFGGNGEVLIQRSLAGVLTTLASTVSIAPGAGSTLALACGTSTGARFFEAQVNGSTVLTASDATSSLGAGFRGYGHGALAEGSLLILGQATPARLNAWAAIDN